MKIALRFNKCAVFRNIKKLNRQIKQNKPLSVGNEHRLQTSKKMQKRRQKVKKQKN